MNKPNEEVLTDIDGNVYKTVKIGNQLWMAENLKTTRYRDGKTCVKVTDKYEWEDREWGACCAYDNKDANADSYGLLYNWYAVNHPSRIAPEGWHVPSDEEWKELELYLGINESEIDNSFDIRGTNEGSKLKEAGIEHWNKPGESAANETGFCALPGGYRGSNGDFFSIGTYTKFWTSSEYNNKDAWFRSLNDEQGIMRFNCNKKDGSYVRLVKD